MSDSQQCTSSDASGGTRPSFDGSEISLGHSLRPRCVKAVSAAMLSGKVVNIPPSRHKRSRAARRPMLSGRCCNAADQAKSSVVREVSRPKLSGNVPKISQSLMVRLCNAVSRVMLSGNSRICVQLSRVSDFNATDLDASPHRGFARHYGETRQRSQGIQVLACILRGTEQPRSF